MFGNDSHLLSGMRTMHNVLLKTMTVNTFQSQNTELKSTVELSNLNFFLNQRGFIHRTTQMTHYVTVTYFLLAYGNGNWEQHNHGIILMYECRHWCIVIVLHQLNKKQLFVRIVWCPLKVSWTY